MSELTREELRKLNLVRVEGQLVERDALRIAERINDYDPKLYLQYLEQAQGVNEPPFRVMEICRDGIHRVAFTAWTLDERLIQRIREADTAATNPSENILSFNEKLREEAKRRYQEKKDEQRDLVEHVLKSPKGKYSFKDPETGKMVTFE